MNCVANVSKSLFSKNTPLLSGTAFFSCIGILKFISATCTAPWEIHRNKWKRKQHHTWKRNETIDVYRDSFNQLIVKVLYFVFDSTNFPHLTFSLPSAGARNNVSGLSCETALPAVVAVPEEVNIQPTLLFFV